MSSRYVYYFPSHSFGYSDQRKALQRLLEDCAPPSLAIASVAPTDEHPIHANNNNFRLAIELIHRIARADVLLVLVGLYASHSTWMNFEVAVAAVLGKPIIEVAPRGQERLSQVAAGLSEREPVRWNGASIWNAIVDALPQHRRNLLLPPKVRVTRI